jgi:predicted lactoylglutathione lyase
MPNDRWLFIRDGKQKLPIEFNLQRYNGMAKQVFINLAVKDLQKSMDFYTALGFTNNPQFSDDTAKCMVWSENIFVMIMTHEKFGGFTTKPIADTKTNIAGLFSLFVESNDEINSILTKGLNAGGIEPSEMKDYGFMVQRTIEDFDGHTWEIFYMDITKFPQQS